MVLEKWSDATMTATAMTSANRPLCYGALRIDPRASTVTWYRAAVELTAREFELLAYLARHVGQVFTRQQLLDRVRGFELDHDPNTIAVYIRRLREKIEPDYDRPRHLKTVWGVGYTFESETVLPELSGIGQGVVRRIGRGL